MGMQQRYAPREIEPVAVAPPVAGPSSALGRLQTRIKAMKFGRPGARNIGLPALSDIGRPQKHADGRVRDLWSPRRHSTCLDYKFSAFPAAGGWHWGQAAPHHTGVVVQGPKWWCNRAGVTKDTSPLAQVTGDTSAFGWASSSYVRHGAIEFRLHPQMGLPKP
jgi:hypothetical protein